MCIRDSLKGGLGGGGLLIETPTAAPAEEAKEPEAEAKPEAAEPEAAEPEAEAKADDAE